MAVPANPLSFGGGQSASATSSAGPAEGSSTTGGSLTYNARGTGISTGVVVALVLGAVVFLWLTKRKA